MAAEFPASGRKLARGAIAAAATEIAADPAPDAQVDPQPDSRFDSGLNASGPYGGLPLTRPRSGWRIWLLGLVVLFAAFGVFTLTRELARQPGIDAVWRSVGPDRVELVVSDDPALQPRQGQAVRAIGDAASSVALDGLALQQSSRWLIGDAERARYEADHLQLSAWLARSTISLFFADGGSVEVRPQPRGIASLPALFWLLVTLGLALCLLGVAAVLAQPAWRSSLYALMAFSQGLNLICMAIESSLDLAQLPVFVLLDMPLRMALDLITAAAMVHAACLHPRRLPGARWIATAGWGMALALIVLGPAGWLPGRWWWLQGAVTLQALVAIGLLIWSYRIEPHPMALMLRRFGIVMACTWLLLSVTLAAADAWSHPAQNVATTGSMIWYVSLASLLLLTPFLARSQLVLREFALLGAMSTIATSLDLLFVAVLSFSPFASLTLALFISLAIYAGARQWVLSELLGGSVITTERMFEQLYRIAREVELRPERTPLLLSQLMRDLFEPIEATVVDRAARATLIADDGSSMLVPVPSLSGDGAEAAVMLRFAQRGRRLFTIEDARLTDRVVEQLRRVVAFDQAVEQGRMEERLRLAQDLHDDIGARLLTLMYKAQSPEMEDYVRHTLQDLKTLTRGLAKSNHRLSHSAGEWKADLTQRLTAARLEFEWSLTFDEDALLTVVHWSALTRVLRELVSNVIAHSQASRLEIDINLARNRLELKVTDNGTGRNPRGWSHGLGLGGIRKRVKQLGGEVEWREAAPQGVMCRVTIPALSARR